MVQKLIAGLLGDGILAVSVSTLLSNVITGTSVSDLLMVYTLPVIVAAGGLLAGLRWFLS